MVFDFLGDKAKVIIAMAHIGALPGSPLYDADGGVGKLIEGVLKDIDALQAGGVDASNASHSTGNPQILLDRVDLSPMEGSDSCQLAALQTADPQPG